MREPDTARPRPIAALADLAPYRIPPPVAPVDLRLDGNEGPIPPAGLLDDLEAAGPEILRRYPDPRPLETLLAARLGLPPDRVLATAGADDALDRACRAFLGPGREIVLPRPSFEMIERFARIAGAEPVRVPWPDGPFPTDEAIARIGPRTGAVAIVSPNNPTGAVATAADLRRLSETAPHAVLLVDLAYVEFADEDLTATALALPNALVFRTLSKAWGLAGLRVGYVAGPADLIAPLRAAGLPFAVSGTSLLLAAARLDRGDADVRAFVSRVRDERSRLAALLDRLGARALPSQANFVLARFADASRARDALAGFGIAVRGFPGRPGLDDALRITCPGDDGAFGRLAHALETAFAPEAILFDMDGVLADVSESYRRTIAETCAAFGVAVVAPEIAAAKREPGANDDWTVTRRLLDRRGVHASIEEAAAVFEAIYQGTDASPGLRRFETLLPSRALLERLAARVKLGIVTGRPRSDALRFLEAQGLAGRFDAVICREDAPLKPDPAPVRRALGALGVSRAWMVGDTPDDVRAARAAAVLPLGIVAPGDDAATTREELRRAGAGFILADLDELEGALP
jgi:histidinol-phosphate aminotransferase